MYKYIVILMLSFPVFADNWFVSAGVAWHDKATSGPEVKLDSLLFESEIGREFVMNDNITLQAYFRHTSGIQTKEEGYGLNPIGVRFVGRW